jgi:carbon-monoxide dehydrogenase medium subunit
VFPAPFEYHRPESLDEAIGLLARLGENARVLAGGHSLIPAMKLRLAQPAAIVDLGRVAPLKQIVERGGHHLIVGAMATHAAVGTSPLLAAKCPLFRAAARHIGDLQVRNMGTIGGSLAHADPAADWPAVVLALDAEIEAASAAGRRTIAATEFFVDVFQTALRPAEVLTEIRVAPTGSSVAYVKTEQKASGFAVCGVAVVVDRGGKRVSVGITGVAPVPYRARAVERALAGRAIAADTIAEASRAAAEGVQALDDVHASAEYRAHLAQVNTARALRQAAGL